MRLDRLGRQIGGRRQIDLLQQAFPMQRFHRRRAGLEGIGIEPAAARLDDGALQDILRAAAPKVQLDAVFGLERLAERADVFDRFGGVDIDRALLFRPGDELCDAVGTAVGGDFRERRIRPLRESGCCERTIRTAKPMPRHGPTKPACSAARPSPRRSTALGLPAVLDLEADQPRQQRRRKQLPDHRFKIGKVARQRIERRRCRHNRRWSASRS